jgi:molybdopterin synthase sulfur carrier subunit
LIATFKMLAGKNSLPLEMDNGQSVLDAFFRVLEMVPALKPHWLDQEGQPHVFVHVFLNGDDAATLQDGLNTRLNDGDCLDFIPPVAGG